MEHSALWKEFSTLNLKKRWDPRTLSQLELRRWRLLRLEIEGILFRKSNFPSRDSREHLRVPSNLTVFFHAGGKLEQKPVTNIGEGGCFISHPAPQKNGLELMLDLVLPKITDCLTLKGMVVWTTQQSSNPGMGIQFIHLKPEQRATLYQAIDKLIVSHLDLSPEQRN